MKRGVVETSTCEGQECSNLGSEGKRVKQSCLMDRLYFNKVSFKFSLGYIRTI